MKKEAYSDNLIGANQKSASQIKEKEKRAAELLIINKELRLLIQEKEKRAAELLIANIELAFQNNEKEKRANELLIANKELAFQNDQKEKRAAELIYANKELEQFSYIASHDLQEPLRTVSNYMKVFEEDYCDQLDDNAQKYLCAVNEATKRMSVLIKALLDYSRLGRNSKATFVDCKKLIADVIADLETMISSSGTTIYVSDMPMLDAYETELSQVFQNLISNAIKFRKKGSQPIIRICSKKINNDWQFSVIDNGIGIESKHIYRIFNIFQRLHISETEYEGNGIGLANCKKIVRLHHGEIWVESTIGQESTFYFTIPTLT